MAPKVKHVSGPEERFAVDDVPELDGFISRDHRAIRVYVGFSFLVVVLGITIVLLSFLVKAEGDEGVQGLLLKLGGGFIATLSAFPLREYIVRRDRIAGLLLIKQRWQRLVHGENPARDELEHLRQLVMKLYEQAVLG